MRYLITAPAHGFTGESAGVQFVKGHATVDTDVEAERRALSYFKKAGYVTVELDAEGNPVTDDQTAVDTPEGVASSFGPATPAENPQVTGLISDPDGTLAPASTEDQAVLVGEQTNPDSPAVVVNPDQARHDAAPDAVLPSLPSPTANKPEWIAAAELRGWTYEQADNLTKPQLIEALQAGQAPTSDEQDTEGSA